jgi:GDP-4-dehydro-6-deoxy-D-mannose reductase
MKTLVTGTEGFVGPYLIGELLSKGYEVTGTFKDEIKTKLPAEVKKVHLDILDLSDVKKAFEKAKPDVIFHLAGISNVKFSIDNPEITMKINVEGTKNILEAAFCMKKRPKVLVIGSAEEYGIPKKVPITEDLELNPVTPYAKSKVEAEKIAFEYVKKGLDAIILRSFNHIGPGQTDGFVCSAFAKQISEIEKGKEPVIFVGNLESKRDFTDVRDVVKAYLLAIEKGKPGIPYNICSGNAYQIKDILSKLLKMSKVKIEVKEDKTRMRKSDIPILQGDNSRFLKATGWKPKIKLEESLKDILEEWRKIV